MGFAVIGTLAALSSVTFAPTMSVPPPTSDIITAVWPCGPTSRISTSAGNVWLIAFSRTVTFASWIGMLVTLISDGYGEPGPTIVGIVIEVELVKVYSIPVPAVAD